MNLLAVLTPPYIYHVCSTQKVLWEVNFTIGELTPVKIKIVVVAMLGKIGILRMERSTSTWTSR